MAASETTLTPARKRRVRRGYAWAAGLVFVLAAPAVGVRAVLVRQMRLPRLTITQDGCVTAVAVTPDGQTIFSGEGPAYDAAHFVQQVPRDVFVWRAADGHLLRRLPAFFWRSSGMSASPDGRRVLASGENQRNVGIAFTSRLAVWDWRTGQKQWSVLGTLPQSFSPDGRFVGCENAVYDAASGRLICRTSKHIAEDGQCAFTPNGKLIGIIEAGTPDPKTHKMRDDGGKLYYSTTRLHFWYTDTGKEAKDFPFTRVRAFDIARSGQWLVTTSENNDMTGGTDGSVVRRIDFNTGKAVWTRERRMNGEGADPEAVLNSVAVSPNGKYVVLASINSHLVVLDARTGRELFRPFIPPGTTIPDWELPGGLAFSADGRTLVSRCGRRVLVWDASSLQ